MQEFARSQRFFDVIEVNGAAVISLADPSKFEEETLPLNSKEIMLSFCRVCSNYALNAVNAEISATQI